MDGMDAFDALCFRQLVIKQLTICELTFFYNAINTLASEIRFQAMRNVNKCVSSEMTKKNQIIINTHKTEKAERT